VISSNIKAKKHQSEAIKFTYILDNEEVGRAFLYLIKNDLNPRPYGLLEDVFVNEKFRHNGYGKEIIRAVIDASKSERCYKLIATSRFEREKVHELYKGLGFSEHGLEFRMNFDK